MCVLFNNAVFMSQKMADYLWQKQQVTSNNIANVSTPGYKAQYVTFQEELKNQLNSYDNFATSSIRSGIEDASIRIETKEDKTTRLDENNVNMDVEQVELASAQIQYQMTIENINYEFNRLRSVIK